MQKKVIGIGAAAIGKEDDVLISYALGSCVGICLYDPVAQIGGMVHILLPDSKLIPDKPDVYRYADTGITALCTKMQIKGAVRSRMYAKVAGGACMFASEISTNIGKRNVNAVRQILQNLAIPIKGEDVEKNYGRSIWFYCSDGLVKVKSARNINIEI